MFFLHFYCCKKLGGAYINQGHRKIFNLWVPKKRKIANVTALLELLTALLELLTALLELLTALLELLTALLELLTALLEYLNLFSNT